ncbi:MAG: hypothetical protein JNK87_40635 [Bryobacterales bacterium]|nr:hypothetical protein [Bryobacterales bacterium]
MVKSHTILAAAAILGGLLIAAPQIAEAQAPMNVFTPPRGTPCTPEPGWWNCFVLVDPKITIMSLDGTSEHFRMAVANIYGEMTKRLSAKYPKAKMNGYKIYLTNGKPWSALANLQPIGSMWPDKTGEMSGDWLRGGTTMNYLWIDEQMMCKTGVKTRGAKDKSQRTYDQVIHEFGHAFAYRFGLDGRINTTWPGNRSAPENFAWSVQYWFSSPAGGFPESKAWMEEMFTSKASFSCQGYKP